MSPEKHEVRLGDLLVVRKGTGYKGEDLDDPEATDRLLSITAIQPSGGFRSAGLRPFSGRFKDSHVCRPGDIVVALTDLTQDGKMLGSPAQVPVLDGTLVASHHVARISDLSSEISGDWLYYRLCAPDWALRASAWATGSTVRQFRPEALESWTIPLPTVEEQQRIARVLTALDRKAHSNAKLVRSLHRHAEALYQQAAANTEGRVPLGTIAARHSTSLVPAQHPDELFEHFSIPALDAGVLSRIDEGRSLLSAKFSLPDGAVAIAKLNPDTKRVLRAVRRTNLPAVCSSEFVVLLPVSEVSPALLYAMLAFDRHFYESILASVTGTTNSHQRVSATDILDATVPAFDSGTIEWLNTRLSNLEMLGVHMHLQSARLDEVRDKILPRFVRGERLLSARHKLDSKAA